MMAEKIAAGWDGGGTKTRVCLKDAYGKDIAVCDFGPLNINGASEEVVRQSIRDAVQFMQQSCGKDMVCPELVIGMAGVWRRPYARPGTGAIFSFWETRRLHWPVQSPATGPC